MCNTERPTPPGDYECCESGCEPCVWDTYYAELNAWQAKQAAVEKPQEPTPNDETHN